MRLERVENRSLYIKLLRDGFNNKVSFGEFGKCCCGPQPRHYLPTLFFR